MLATPLVQPDQSHVARGYRWGGGCCLCALIQAFRMLAALKNSVLDQMGPGSHRVLLPGGLLVSLPTCPCHAPAGPREAVWLPLRNSCCSGRGCSACSACAQLNTCRLLSVLHYLCASFLGQRRAAGALAWRASLGLQGCSEHSGATPGGTRLFPLRRATRPLSRMPAACGCHLRCSRDPPGKLALFEPPPRN